MLRSQECTSPAISKEELYVFFKKISVERAEIEQPYHDAQNHLIRTAPFPATIKEKQLFEQELREYEEGEKKSFYEHLAINYEKKYLDFMIRLDEATGSYQHHGKKYDDLIGCILPPEEPSTDEGNKETLFSFLYKEYGEEANEILDFIFFLGANFLDAKINTKEINKYEKTTEDLLTKADDVLFKLRNGFTV